MLSEKEKDALAEYFRGKDIYKPSEDSRQEPADFAPKGMCNGGEGFAKGGPIKASDGLDLTTPDMIQGDDFSGPDISGDTHTARGKIANPPQTDLAMLANRTSAPEIATEQPANRPTMPAKAPETSDPTLGLNPYDLQAAAANLTQTVPAETGDDNAPAPSPVKSLQPDQWDELVNALKAKPTIGQSAMSGLAGLADAISTGVARSANPGFQRNIMEQNQNQKQNLIQALTAKYGHERAQQELGLRGQELKDENMRAANAITAENARAANQVAAEKARTGAELGVRAQEAQAGRQQSGIEAAARLPATGLLHPSTWGKGAEIEKVRQQLLSQGAAPANLPVVKSQADYAKLPKGTAYQNEKGEPGVKS